MIFEWDERKRLSNLEKHGLDFLDVTAIFEAPHVKVSSVYDGEEDRFLAIGYLKGVLLLSFIPLEARPSGSFHLGGHAMKKDKNIRRYTAAELKAKRAKSGTDLNKLDAISDKKLELLITEDEDERDIRPDWTRSILILPHAKQSIHLRLDQDIIEFFKGYGKGHITRMQAVLKAYVDAHRPHAK